MNTRNYELTETHRQLILTGLQSIHTWAGPKAQAEIEKLLTVFKDAIPSPRRLPMSGNNLNIELRGSEESFRKLVGDIALLRHIFRDPGHPLANFIAEIEDQLEPNADRSMDYISLDELYEEQANG